MSYSHDYHGLFGLGQTKTYSPAEIAAAARQAVSVVTTLSAEQLLSPVTAVRSFQNIYGHGLTVDGIYGPATRAALAEVTGQRNLPPPPSRTPSIPSITPSSATPSTSPTEVVDSVTASGPPSWLVPVAVVGTVVAVAGVVLLRRKRAPVTANKRRRRASKRRKAA